MKEKFYQISKGSLYYLNLLWESASDEMKVNVEYASKMIEEQLLSVAIPESDYKTLHFDASTLEESELVKMTILRLKYLVVYNRDDNARKLITYISNNKSILNKPVSRS